MSDPPESVERNFFGAWADPKPDELGSFFHDDAVWVDGPKEVRRGANEIKRGQSPPGGRKNRPW